MRMNLRRSVAVVAGAMMAVGAATLASADTTGERVAGADRYLTSVAISKKLVPDDVGTVFVASGESYPDAVVAGAAGGAFGYPVLLTEQDSVPDAVLVELERLDPMFIVLLGGPAAVTFGVEEALREYGVVTRLGDENRYGTAVKLSRWAFEPGLRTAYLASGSGFADALSGGVAGARVDGPVLLTDSNELSPETAAHLAEYEPREIVVLGGSAAISEGVAAAAAEFAPVSRLAGPDRYATSAAISSATFKTAATVLLANGTTFPDALSGTPLAAKLRAPVLLVEHDAVPAPVCAEIRRLGPSKVIALGGVKAVSDSTVARATTCAEPALPTPTPGPTTGPTAAPSR